MSSKRITILTEGISDKAIYDKISGYVFPDCGYTLLKASDFKGISDGKGGVVNLFKATKGNRPIKKLIFILDKDVDDFTGDIIKHPNIFYTTLYNIENEIVTGSDIIKCLSVVCNETTEDMGSRLDNPTQFLSAIISNHRTWLTYCFLSRTNKALTRCPNYSCKRPLFTVHKHTNVFRNPRTKTFFRELRKALGLKTSTFLELLNEKEAQVKTLIEESNGDRIFNGKWYFNLISCTIKDWGIFSQTTFDAFEKRLRDVMVSCFPSTAPIVSSLRIATSSVLDD